MCRNFWEWVEKSNYHRNFFTGIFLSISFYILLELKEHINYSTISGILTALIALIAVIVIFLIGGFFIYWVETRRLS